MVAIQHEDLLFVQSQRGVQRGEGGITFQRPHANRAFRRRHSRFRHVHAAGAPIGPVDGKRAALPFAARRQKVAMGGEGIEESIAGGVICLPRIAQRARRRGEQQQEAERTPAQRRIEIGEAGHLRRQHGAQLRRLLAHQQLVAGDAGGMDDAIQMAVRRIDFVGQRPHRGRVRHIDLAIIHRRRQRRQRRVALLGQRRPPGQP